MRTEPDAVFINGINTTEAEAMLAAELLGKMTGLLVRCRHNSDDGISSDLLECIRGRWLFIVPRKLVRQNAAYLRWVLDRRNGNLVIFAHSQGTMIAINAVRLLSSEYRARCQLILFAPTNSYEPLGLGHCEYFRTRDDYVCANLWFGDAISRLAHRIYFAWTKKEDHRGAVYTGPGGGHALQEAYLNKICSFYGFPQSLMFQLMKGVSL